MKQRKFKKYVVSSFYILAVVIFSGSIYLLEKKINNKQFKDRDNIQYVDDEIISENEYIPVIVEDNTIMKPFLIDQINVNKSYYNYEGDTSSQENSIIFYENTYLQNSGIDYSSQETFDIISILDGTVIEVSDNEILGKTIKIKHSNDIISTYQSLSNVSIKEKDNVVRGQVIGQSGTCNLYKNNYNLHFELYNKWKNVNPEDYYNKSVDEL